MNVKVKGAMVGHGPWDHPYKAINVLCFDGRRRTVQLNLQADSWFSWPGRCKIKNKSIRGYVAGLDNGDLEFRIYDSEWSKLGIEKPL